MHLTTQKNINVQGIYVIIYYWLCAFANGIYNRSNLVHTQFNKQFNMQNVFTPRRCHRDSVRKYLTVLAVSMNFTTIKIWSKVSIFVWNVSKVRKNPAKLSKFDLVAKPCFTHRFYVYVRTQMLLYSSKKFFVHHRRRCCCSHSQFSFLNQIISSFNVKHLSINWKIQPKYLLIFML